jgi:PAS domain S-box-containing protein
MGRILVVEDSPTQSHQLQCILEKEGYLVEVAPDGEQGFEVFSASDFDLVISDVLMPGISGYELCRKIKDDPARRDVLIILLTALTDPMDIIQGLECGADNFITKSTQPDDLLGRVRTMLDHKTLRTGGKFKVGAEVVFLGKRLTINSDKEQILNLLISTFEDVVRTNRELRAKETELVAAKSQVDKYARQLEGQVRSTEDKYQKLMEQAQDAIFIVDTSGTVQEVNLQAEKLLGQPAAEVVGCSYEKWVPASELDHQRAQFRKLLAGGSARMDNARLNRVDGTLVCVDYSSSLVEVDGEGVVLVILHDVTERNRTQEAVARLAALVEGSEDAIICRNLDGIITSWNPGAERLYGYTAQEAVGQHLSVIVPAERSDELAKMMEQIRRGERVAPVQTVGRQKDGSLIDVAVSVSPVRDTSCQLIGASIIAQDITGTKRLEEQFRQAQKMEAVGQLAGGVAHDFNNLLTVISGYSEVLLSRLPATDPASGLLQEIHKAGERAAGLTRQLLAFSRKQIIQPKVLDLNALASDVGKMLRRMIGEDVSLVTVLAPRLGRVKADPGQIEQVLMNLAVNSRDAMPEGGKLTIETANVELERSYTQGRPEVQPGSYVLLAVSDTGCGMTEEVKAHIFEPFFTTKEPGKGTGLGLATAYGIVKQSGGYVYVYSEPGHGTTFKIYLPLVEDGIPSGKSYPDPKPMPHGSETILLVEDEDAVRSLTRYILQMQGYAVLEAKDGEEALRVAEQHRGGFHLLMTDVVMPRMGGRRLAERLAQTQPGVKVLFLSGYTDDAVVRHGVLEAEVAFLQKPFTPSALTQKVRDVLDR